MDVQFILITVCALAATGLIAALILYFVSQKFKVYEDPRIGQVEGVLPGANCGGCGFPGCHGMAEALVKAEDLSKLMCPVGGADCMSKVAAILGKEVTAAAPKVAVVRCNGNCAARPKTANYDGARSCAIAAAHFAGETACSYGCLGCGDCVAACKFDAIKMNPETGLPEVDDEKCVACGACVKACPKNIIELRNKGVKNRRIWVSCVNKDKGAVAMKACKSACIGCGKCAKECPFGAITVENNVAYIDYTKCKMCRKCVAACPTKAIHAINFPPLPAPKPAEQKPADAAPAGQTPLENKPAAPAADAQPTKPQDTKAAE
ncbi:MAG: Fe-S cluster domain-containing protein [Bacteroidales bacterium]|nr:Fe-S cluster domain-containing protein [Bacteroidales bacterium]